MRNYMFLLVFLPMPLIAALVPWAGLMVWGWLSLVSPHRLLFGFFGQQPYNLVIALAVFAGLILDRGRSYSLKINSTLIIQAFFIFSILVSTYFSEAPPNSLSKYQDLVNVILFTVLLQIFLVNRFRIEMAVLLIVMCIGSFGLQGGLLFILSGGNHEFAGPPRSPIGDRNNLAIAMAMVIPLINYFRESLTDRLLKLGCAALIFFTVLAIVSTGSRGGFVTLIVVGVALVWRSRQRFITLALAGAAVSLVVTLAPSEWVSRIKTIETASEEDKSFQNRLYSWEVYTRAGLANPLTGAGVYAVQHPRVYFSYAPYEGSFERVTERSWAAHSIYFQVLGEMGVIAFLVYVATPVLIWIYCSRIARRSETDNELAWCGPLVRMIQASMLGFLVGAGTVSMAFYDVYWMLIAIVGALKLLVDSRVDKKVAITARSGRTARLPEHAHSLRN